MKILSLLLLFVWPCFGAGKAVDLQKFTELTFEKKIDLKNPVLNQMLSFFDENKYESLRNDAVKKRLEMVCKSSKTICEAEKKTNIESDVKWREIVFQAKEKKSLEHQIFLGLYTYLQETPKQGFETEKLIAFTDLSYILLTTWENRLKKIQPDQLYRERAIDLAVKFHQ